MGLGVGELWTETVSQTTAKESATANPDQRAGIVKPVDNLPPNAKEEYVTENVKVKTVKIHNVEARLEFQSDREPNLNLIAPGKSPGEKEELEQGSTFANRARINKRKKM